MATISDDQKILSPHLLAQLERMELVSRKVFRGRMKGERKSRRKAAGFTEPPPYLGRPEDAVQAAGQLKHPLWKQKRPCH